MTEANVTTKAKSKNLVTKEQLTVAQVKEQLFLDEATGYFYAQKDSIAYKKGDFVGSVNIVTGLYKLQLFCTLYSGKDLAFFYLNGTWNPELAPRRGRAANGAPKTPKVVKEHTPRMAPVITPEAIEAAKAEAAAKKAALKAKKAAASEVAEGKTTQA
jgi:hypothetical protein